MVALTVRSISWLNSTVHHCTMYTKLLLVMMIFMITLAIDKLHIEKGLITNLNAKVINLHKRYYSL